MQSVPEKLDQLDEKITGVISLCDSLRAENIRLKRLLSIAERDKKNLSEHMMTARNRLEQLIFQLPEKENLPGAREEEHVE